MNIDGIRFDKDVKRTLECLQWKEYRRRFEDALLGVMESFILDVELDDDAKWKTVRLFSELRLHLRSLAGKEEDSDEDSDD